jgi:UDP-N-acetylmuramate dehydrogenase
MISLQPYNTFGIQAHALALETFSSIADCRALLNQYSGQREQIKILGGGSNILLTKDLDAIILKNEIKGIHLLEENEKYFVVKCGAGEVWHDFVIYSIQQGWQGLENLSLIPGTVGAAPMQNIGAYGVEVKDYILYVEAMDYNGVSHIFTGESCRFGYRESIFKHEYRDRMIITSVTFQLNKNPQYNTTYGVIEETMQSLGLTEISSEAISKAVIHIRSSKLPNPAEIGNAGSFFKNPEIKTSQYEQLKSQYPQIPGYVIHEEVVKVPAGWLIEQCGWKGYRKDDYGVHEKQALVLVNYQHASGQEILKLSDEIIASVQEKFYITLHKEVNIW